MLDMDALYNNLLDPSNHALLAKDVAKETQQNEEVVG